VALIAAGLLLTTFQMSAEEMMLAETFYPPKKDVELALREIGAYPKKAGLLGLHGSLELGMDVPTNALYGVLTRESIEEKRRQYQKDGIVPDAEWVKYWMSKSDEEIYAMISPENPRALVPSYTQGHPLQPGNFNSMVPIWGKPDRYRAAADGSEWGPGMKVKNPATGEMVEITDDGNGWEPPEGFPNRLPFRFKAAYRNYQIRKLVYFPYNGEHEFDGPSYRQHASPVYALAVAYAVTGEQKYADRVLLILNRLAENYRKYTSNHDVGWSWTNYIYRAYIDDENNECAIIINLLLSYDLVWDAIPSAKAVESFFAQKGNADYNEDGDSNTEDLSFNIEKNLFGYTWEFLKRADAVAVGNTGIRQNMARLQLALVFQNDTIMDFILDGVHGFNATVNGSIYRDGRYYEDSSFYSQVTNNYILEMERMLAAYKGGGKYAQGVVLDPAVTERLAAARTWEQREASSGRALGLGDSPSSRTPIFQDDGKPPVDLHAHEAGLTVMRQGADALSRYNVLLFHGDAGFGHGHQHQLVMKILAYGYDFSADLGYPYNFTSHKWPEWTKATLSHQTVVVNQRSQRERSSASLSLRGKAPGIQVASAFSPNAYSKAELYHRTVAVVETKSGKSLVVDFFRIIGGSTHDYSTHSLSGNDGKNFSVDGAAELQAKPGTLAGKDVAVNANTPGGYSFISDLKVGKTPKSFSATWRTGDKDGTAYRIHVPGGFDGEVITGRAEAEGALGLSPLDAYMILRRQGASPLRSAFVTVHEAFQKEADGIELERVPVGPPFTDAQMPISLRIRTKAGDDIVVTSILSGSDPTEAGFSEAFQVRKNEDVYELNWPKKGHLPDLLRGSITSVDYKEKEITVKTPDDLSGVAGRDIYISNPSYARTTTFEIASVQKQEDGIWKLKFTQYAILGQGTLVEEESSPGELKSILTIGKLFNNPGLCDGKTIQKDGETASYRIKSGRLVPPEGTASKYQIFSLENESDVRKFAPGERYSIYDYGVGDSWYICQQNTSKAVSTVAEVQDAQSQKTKEGK
jgi:hypothetical protein